MNKARFLFVSHDALTADLAWRVAREGHEVKYYIGNPTERDIGEGLFTKVRSWEREVPWADVIILDDVYHGLSAHTQQLRMQGKHVIGGTPYTDTLELDRSFGQEELKRLGIPIIPYRDFTSFDDAISFVRDKPDRYVLKPNGEAQNIKHLLFVGIEEDGSDVVRVLEAYKRVWAKELLSFHLQKRVSGVEIGIGGFFNGRHFLEPINVNFEHKKLFPGNIGPSTDEMGTSMFWTKPNRLFNDTLRKFEAKLREEQYVGYADLNCIVNGTGIYPLEFTMRFGYPTIHIQTEGLSMPVAEFLMRMAAGESFEIKVRRGYQLGVMLVVPPFPYRDKRTFDSYSRDAAIVFKRPAQDGIHIGDVKSKEGQWLVTGSTGIALIVCGTGTTMSAAKAQAYARIQNVMIPNLYYRDDIGERWVEDSDRLYSWGYLGDSS